MGARLLALHAQAYRARGNGGARLLGGGDRHQHLGAVAGQFGEHAGVRAAEREAHDRHALATQHVELRGPVVVAAGRLAELDAVPLGLGREPLCVRVERGAVHG